MPNENKQNQVVQTDNLNNNLISSEEVEVAVRGDEEALEKQMERVKELAKKDEISDKEKQALALQKKKQQEALEKQKQQEQEKRLIEEHKKQEEIRKQQELQKQQELKKQQELQKQQSINSQNKQPLPQKQEEEPKPVVQKNQVPNQKDLATKKEETTDNQRFIGFKRFGAFLFLGGVLAMIWFIPQINDFINDYKKSKMPVVEITTGSSICTLEKTYEEKDVKTTMRFKFVNRKINKLEYVTETRSNESKEKNAELHNECLLLKKEAEGLSGVVISCSLNGKVITSKQILNYEYIDSEKLSNAYLEAGGVYPDIKNGDDIGTVEEKLIKTGYKCEREEM